jgi:two-component system, OmpR family, KDP operon response regulator KdpE
MAEPCPLVLVIEDERQMCRFLHAALEPSGYRVIDVPTAREGLAQAAGRNPDLILLDLGLPDTDGLDVTKQIREWSQVPIIVLSARGREEDKVAALDAGADDYVTKPFAVGELLARMRVALRHATHAAGDASEPVFDVGELRVDRARRQVFLAGTEVHLTPTEYRLLACLTTHAGRVLTHRQLLKEVWGVNSGERTHYLRVYMTQLRHKLEREPARPRYLLTELGVGYRLRAD